MTTQINQSDNIGALNNQVDASVERENCKLVDSLIEPCITLQKATSDYQGHYKKGLSILPITKFDDNRNFRIVKHYLIVKNGDFAKNGIICNYCPFCGKAVYADTKGNNLPTEDSDTNKRHEEAHPRPTQERDTV